MTSSEHSRVELKVPKDSRALGAMRGALQHSAAHLGLTPEEERELIASADRLLRSAFTSLLDEQKVLIEIQEFPDRIEIEMARPGLGTEEWSAAEKLPGIDRAELNTNAGQTRLRLVKFLTAARTPSSEN